MFGNMTSVTRVFKKHDSPVSGNGPVAAVAYTKQNGQKSGGYPSSFLRSEVLGS